MLKKGKKVQQKPVYALHALLIYQTIPIPYVAIRVITGIMGLVWTYLLKIFLSLGEVLTFFGNATVVFPLTLRHLKHWKWKLTPSLLNKKNPELKYNQLNPQNLLKYYKTIIMIITIEFVFPELVKAKMNHLLIDNLLIKKKWKKSSEN